MKKSFWQKAIALLCVVALTLTSADYSVFNTFATGSSDVSDSEGVPDSTGVSENSSEAFGEDTSDGNAPETDGITEGTSGEDATQPTPEENDNTPAPALFSASLLGLAAGEYEDGDFTYTVSGLNATIIKYRGTDSSVNVPGNFGEYTVVGISNNVFMGCSNLTSITLPSSLTSLGYGVFSGTKLTTVTIPQNVTYMGYGSGSLDPYSNYVFTGATQLKEVVFESGMRTIPSRSLAFATNVTKVIIPSSVETIGDYAFYGINKSTLTIWCYEGYVEQYAIDNNIDYKIIGTAVTPTDKESQVLKFGENGDVFNFTNDAQISHDWNGTRGYYISAQYYSILLDSFNLIDRGKLKKEMEKKWGGSCFGMSAVVQLTKAKWLTPSFFQKTPLANSLYKFNKPIDSTTVESLINYYHLLQFNNTAQKYYTKFKKIDNKTRNESLVNALKNSSYPVIVGIASKSGAHQIAAFSVSSEPEGYVISIYDPNYKTQRQIVMSEDFSSFSYGSYNEIIDFETVEDNQNGFRNLQSILEIANAPSPVQPPPGPAPTSKMLSSSIDTSAESSTALYTNYDNFKISLYETSGVLVSFAEISNGEKIDGDIEISGYAQNELGYELSKVFDVPNMQSGQYYEIIPSANERSVVTNSSISQYDTYLKFDDDTKGFFAVATANESGKVTFYSSGEVSTNYTAPANQEVSVTINNPTTSWYTVTYEGVTSGLDVNPSAGDTKVKTVDNANLKITANNDFNEIEFDNVPITPNNGVTLSELERKGVLTNDNDEEVAESAPLGHSVVFFTFSSDTIDALTNVPPNSKITAPAAPNRNGYTFEGWYTDLGYTNKWNFDNDVVTDDMRLYAHYVDSNGATRLIGDIDGDGEVGNRDVVKLKRYLAGWQEEANIDTDVADIDGIDGVNERDYLILRRAVMDWEEWVGYIRIPVA